jgi:hypothetical protein
MGLELEDMACRSSCSDEVIEEQDTCDSRGVRPGAGLTVGPFCMITKLF